MPTLKIQKADGTFEFLQLAGEEFADIGHQVLDVKSQLTQTETDLRTRSINLLNYAHLANGNDWTTAFEQALSEGLPLLVPYGEYIVTRTLFPTNSIMGTGSPRITRINNNGTTNGRLFWVKSYQGTHMEISGLRLVSDWNGTATANEHGHAIALGGCKNVTVKDNIIEGFYGDGIYIGRGGDTHQANPVRSENIKIINNDIKNVYRGCVTLISCDLVYIDRNRMSKNIAYQAMIACESNTSVVERITNVYISNNEAIGKDIFCRMYQANGAENSRYRNIHLTKNNVKARRMFMATGGSNGVGNISDIFLQDNIFAVHEEATSPTHFCDIYNHCKENVYITGNIIVGGAVTIRDVKNVHVLNNSITNANIENMRCNFLTFEGNEVTNGGSFTADGVFQNTGAEGVLGPFLINNKFINCVRGIGFKGLKVNYGVLRDNYFNCSDIALDLGLTANVADSNIHLFNNNYVNTPTKIRNPARLRYFTEGVTQTISRKPFTFNITAPTSGEWNRGEIVFNTSPSANGYTGWICVTAGTPGVWKGFGLIEE